jgi:hypothetical protein
VSKKEVQGFKSKNLNLNVCTEKEEDITLMMELRRIW